MNRACLLCGHALTAEEAVIYKDGWKHRWCKSKAPTVPRQSSWRRRVRRPNNKYS